MTALRKSNLPDHFRNELARLSRAGFCLLPLGGGADGKAPLLRSWADPKVTLSRVLGPLHRTGSQVYGVRLDGLAVIDCDDDSPELVTAMEARFGVSPAHVKTPRGRHLYYRANGKAPNLRGEGLPVDIKTGPCAYVVGPLSERPDGGLYVPAKGLLGDSALPLLRVSCAPPSASASNVDLIPQGERHEMLVREAMRMVESVDGAEELTVILQAVRDDTCANAATMPESEVAAIAGWAWKLRLENRVYSGRDSAFRVDRRALDALRSCDNETDAIALYMLLVDMHGHSPGKRFPLDFESMRRAGLTRQTVRRLRAARGSLQAIGLLTLVGKHCVGARKQMFCLMKVRPTAENVKPLLSTTSREDRGGL